MSESLLYQSYCCNFIKNEAPALVFSFKYCEIFRNNFFYSKPPVAAFEVILKSYFENQGLEVEVKYNKTKLKII